MNNEEIKRQAKEIIDKFSKALENISMKETRVERENDRRKEEEGNFADSDFREIIFKNAPKTKNFFIEAEKGAWLE